MNMVRAFIFILVCSMTTALAQSGSSDELNEREELAVTALEALMSAPSERALPLVQKVLNGNHSDRVKSRALFVLGQINLPEAQSALIEFAENANSALQTEAIRMIGISGKTQALEGIYASGSMEIKHQVLQAYMIAGDKQSVYRIASNADDDKEFDEAIKMLGVMGAVDELRELAERGNLTESLLQAYVISGDLEGLQSLINTEAAADNPELRIQAISSLGVIGGDRASQVLIDTYRDADTHEVRQAALQGMLISGNEEGLLELYRESRDSEEKRDLLRTLGIMGGDAALEAIDAALEGNQP